MKISTALRSQVYHLATALLSRQRECIDWLHLRWARWSFNLLCHALSYFVSFLCFTDRQTFEHTPNALKCQWFIQNLSYNSAIVVSISYWSFIVVMDHSSKYYSF